MSNQKLENELNLSLSLPKEELQKSPDLSVGYDEDTNTWELIVKYNGNIERLESLGIEVEILTNEYAILTIQENNIESLADLAEVEYIEKPKSINFMLNQARRAACVVPVQNVFPGLKGEGVIVGIIDSGIDYAHPDFINDDRSTRIISIWDQTIEGNPPEGFVSGTEYTSEEINQALNESNPFDRLAIVPSEDSIGHGTHVAGIAAGNGRASNGTYTGIAPESDLIVVKLGSRGKESFPRTTELMRALRYIINKAEEQQKPVAINLSFGNNYGSHDGNSLFEAYINEMANEWKSVIVIASGNEGDASHHTSGLLVEGEDETIELAVGLRELSLNIQLWKSYSDDIEILIQSPSGESSGFIMQTLGQQQFTLDQTDVYIYYGMPSPFNIDQEIFIELLPTNTYINDGIWKIILRGADIVQGNFDMWLPTTRSLSTETAFFRPTVNTTLTVPSTAGKVITVGAYNSVTNSIAPFSGRGYTRATNMVKPDLVAPGVDIMSTIPGGGYGPLSGTSMAAPFVTGAAALLMEWGIVRGNDPFLYGEKIKAYLHKSANRNETLYNYPNETWGYGTLCLEQVFTRTLSVQEMLEDPCKNAIVSEEFIDFIVEYQGGDINDILQKYGPDCVEVINDRFAVFQKFIGDENCSNKTDLMVSGMVPALVGPYGKQSLDASGILGFHTQPYVPLRGQGILVGVIDTGIDYMNSVFRYEDNTTKILSLWDQTLQGSPPEGFQYGTEYTAEAINNAIQAEDPYSIVPSRDDFGHGTFLAGIAAGREVQEEDFIGAAPDADLLVVKLKEAKRCLREFYLLGDKEEEVYQETDIMFAVKYLEEKANALDRPLVIIIGLGSNQGAHDGSSYLESFLIDTARRKGKVVSIPSGNEANLAHHFRGQFEKDELTKNIQIRVAEGEAGFILSIWNNAPDKMSISITSPTGEFIDRIPARLTETEEVSLILERTKLFVVYDLAEERTGDQVIHVRFQDPTEGIWTITVYGDFIVDGRFDAWLPREGWIDENTQFLQPDPYTTLTMPSSAIGLLTSGAYDDRSGSLYLSSGRGLTRDEELKPDLVSPGVDVIGPLPGNQFGTRTGTSIASAITGGAAALLLEWGILLGNDKDMDTQKVKNYLIRGATRKDVLDYPNPEWGYGELNLLGTFEAIRGNR